MKTTRRGFFGMVGGAIAAALTPKPLLALAIPPANEFVLFMYHPLPAIDPKLIAYTTFLMDSAELISGATR